MGCVNSKEEQVVKTETPAAAPVKVEEQKVLQAETEAPVETKAEPVVEEKIEPVVEEKNVAKKKKVAIVYYSTYGHIVQLAEAVKEGVDKVDGIEASIYQVQETLPADVLEKMHAPPKKDYPIATPETLAEADAILFGIPTRFGSFPSQMKALFDSTGGLWAKGALVGKPAGLFFSTGTPGGGQETTAYTTVTFLAHHGLIYVPLGYRSPLLFNMEEVHGGSPWGTGTIAGPDGSRQPSKLELDVAKVQGESFAHVALKLAAPAPEVAPVEPKAEAPVETKAEPVVEEKVEPVVEQKVEPVVEESKVTKKKKVAIVYYSTYGHIVHLAEAVKRGVDKAADVEAMIYQVQETLPADVLEKMHAPPKKDYPIATPETLAEADAILFGIPTRFGSFPSQMKALFDSTGGLWAKGALVGKPAGLFFSTGTPGGGQETTAYTTVTFLAHHGLIYVPLGYRSPLLFNMEEVHGGSPWGTGTIAGPDGSRQPSKLELDVAEVQGESFANVAKKL